MQTTSPSPDPADRRSELAIAAYRMIADAGTAGMNLRALARSVGATTGLVSHHFAGRSEVIEAALEHAIEVMRVRNAGRVDAHPLDLLTAVLPTDNETRENWRFVIAVRAAALNEPELRRLDQAIATQWRTHLPAVLAPHVVGDPQEATEHLAAVVDGIAMRAINDPNAWPADRQIDHLKLGFSAVSNAKE